MAAMRILLALAMVCHAHTLQHCLRDPPPPAEVYVINLKSRVDKCQCMQTQLKTLPWPVHRFEAIDTETVWDACPLLLQDAEKKENKLAREAATANMALVCSNYLIWKQFLHKSSAEHLIIFEDDAAILDDGIWESIGKMFDNPCRPWDYLLVDPMGFEKSFADPVCEEQKLYKLTFGFDGSHMQVFTRQAVKSLTGWMHDTVHQRHRGPPVADKLVRAVGDDLKYNLTNVWALNAGVVTQARWYESIQHQPLHCQTTVTTAEDREVHFVEEALFDC